MFDYFLPTLFTLSHFYKPIQIHSFQIYSQFLLILLQKSQLSSKDSFHQNTYSDIQMIDESSQPPNAQVSDSSNSQSKSLKKNTSTIAKRPSKTNEIQENNKSSSNSSEPSQSGSKAQSCINKICPKNKNTSSRGNNNKNSVFDPNELCNDCTVQYKKEAYCLYCKQIYFDSSDDGKEWILCDECGRWVHSQCANYDPMFDSDFKCIKCKKNQVEENDPAMIKKQSTKPNQKPTDRRKLAECSLNAYGFFWQLGPKQLAEDMDKIREYLN